MMLLLRLRLYSAYPPLTALIISHHSKSVLSGSAVPGSDIAGIVVSAGSSALSDALKLGTRGAAMGACFVAQGNPYNDALQAYAIVPATNTVSLPAENELQRGESAANGGHGGMVRVIQYRYVT